MQDHNPSFGAGIDASPPSNGHYKHPKQAENKTVSSIGSNSGGGKSTGGGQGSEDSEADSAEEADGDEDEPERMAASRVYGMGKGKRPSIRVDQTCLSEADDHDAGPTSERLSALELDTPSKKRSYSNASIKSVLHSEAGSDEMQNLSEDYPRKKLSRKLSNANDGLLAYNGLRKQSIGSEEGLKESPEHAIEDSDDEDAYKAVDLIPDDEEENEEDVAMLERNFLKEAYERASDNDSDDEGPDVSLLLDDAGFFDELMPIHGGMPPPSPVPQFAMSDDTSMPPSTSTRRVRFDDEVKEMSDQSSDTSSEDLNNFFPDLFHKESQIASGFHPNSFLDDGGLYEGSTASDSEISYWDVQERGTEWHDVHTESESGSDSSDGEAGSSGYETDEGDTTDEELPPPTTIHMPARVHRDSTSSESTATATPKPFPRSRPKSRVLSKSSGKSAAKPKGPKKGYFTLDPRRAVAVLDVTGKRMCLIPARVPDKDSSAWPASTASSTANNSPRSSFQMLEGGDSDFSESNQPSFADVMLSGMFGVAGGLNYPVGPPEAFYPWVDFDSNGNMVQDDDFEDDEGDDGEGDRYEAMLDIKDILDFGNDSENSGDDDTDYPPAAASPSAAEPGSTPAKQSNFAAHHETGDKLLEHFDRPGVLTSFRRNQTRYRDLARLPDDPELRASTSRPVRTGGSADTIITPLRKRKSSTAAGSPLAPRAGIRRPGPLAGGFSARRH
ncbi:hypothetical protein K490DRAFT_57657 [Saccharata proteae CBS 121410]|uniref:Uncharacterized protein n=1 Tax=Saccharata proteae CBS 121410 TaxID=1314787 RepID=A0A9P4HTU6_9PEZI|nr:hypothetical protein K490DRAFT_57657 [Saccharata proteae CBS 121410]